MKPKSLLLLAFSYLLFTFPSSASLWPWSKSFDLPTLAKNSRAAVMLLITSNGGGEAIVTGTGFVISEDGLLVTNAHVVRPGTRIVAKGEDGRLFQVVGAVDCDPGNDLVLLKLDSGGLPYLRLGKSSALAVGEQVAIIGSPLGLEGTVSDGVVSAFRNDESGRKLIQVTAAISHGSSGSPVLSASGDVVGVATMVLVGGQSLNFAVPVEAVRALSTKKPVESLSGLTASLRLRNASKDPDYQASRKAFERRDWSRAVKALLAFLNRNPESAQGYSDLGFAYAQTERYRDAAVASTRALELDPGEPFDWCNLGDAQMSLENYSEAIAAYKEAIRIDPAGSMANEAWQNLFAMYTALGQRQEAAVALKQWHEALSGKMSYKGEPFRHKGF